MREGKWKSNSELGKTQEHHGKTISTTTTYSSTNTSCSSIIGKTTTTLGFTIYSTTPTFITFNTITIQESSDATHAIITTTPLIQGLPPSIPTPHIDLNEDGLDLASIVIANDEKSLGDKFLHIIKDGVILRFPEEEEESTLIAYLEWHGKQCHALDIFKISNFALWR